MPFDDPPDISKPYSCSFKLRRSMQPLKDLEKFRGMGGDKAYAIIPHVIDDLFFLLVAADLDIQVSAQCA